MKDKTKKVAGNRRTFRSMCSACVWNQQSALP